MASTASKVRSAFREDVLKRLVYPLLGIGITIGGNAVVFGRQLKSSEERLEGRMSEVTKDLKEKLEDGKESLGDKIVNMKDDLSAKISDVKVENARQMSEMRRYLKKTGENIESLLRHD